MKKAKILAITGAVRDGAYTNKLAYMSKRYFVQHDVEYTIFDISQAQLPMYDEKEESLKNTNVQKLFMLVRAADGIVLISPEYHGSMSGALKNVLDWLNYLEDEDFLQGKVVGLMGGGGSFGSSGAMIQMMMSVRALHGWLMPDVLVNIPKISRAFSENSEFKEEIYDKRLKHFASNLVKYANLFKSNKEVFRLK